MSTAVSLPSIHEMFPEHLMQISPNVRLGICSASSNKPAIPPSSLTSPRSSSNSSSSSFHKTEPVYSFDVLRCDPSSSSLQHIASSATVPNHAISVPLLPHSRDEEVSKGFTPAFRVNAPANSFNPPTSPASPSSGFIHDTSLSHLQHAVPSFTTDTFPSSEDVSDEGDDKKHICSLCHKRFNRPSSLRIHMNTHTGATPFCCPYPGCGRKFNVNSNMRRHYRNHNASPTTRFTQTSTSPSGSPPSTPFDSEPLPSRPKNDASHEFLILRPDVPIDPGVPSILAPNSQYANTRIPSPLSDSDSSMDTDEKPHTYSYSERMKRISPYKLQPVSADFYERSHHQVSRALSPISPLLSTVSTPPLAASRYSDVRSQPPVPPHPHTSKHLLRVSTSFPSLSAELVASPVPQSSISVHTSTPKP